MSGEVQKKRVQDSTLKLCFEKRRKLERDKCLAHKKIQRPLDRPYGTQGGLG